MAMGVSMHAGVTSQQTPSNRSSTCCLPKCSWLCACVALGMGGTRAGGRLGSGLPPLILPSLSTHR